MIDFRWSENILLIFCLKSGENMYNKTNDASSNSLVKLVDRRIVCEMSRMV